MTPRGQFMVVEGLDGAGTTTLSRRIAQALEAEGQAALWTCEPSTGPVGRMIREALEADASPTQQRLRDPETLALLFAADRRDHVQTEVIPALEAGRHVVCDRYLYSSVGYQSFGAADPAAMQAWIGGLQPISPMPDLVLSLNVSADVAAQRRAGRGDRETFMEASARQHWLADFYAALPEHFPSAPIVLIDAAGTPDAVFDAAWAQVTARLAQAG